MTRELLKQANQLQHAITDTEGQIKIVTEMMSVNFSLQIRTDQIGSVTLDDDTKSNVLALVYTSLNNKRDELENKLRLL